MSDRKDSFFLQLVDEAFFDACFDDLEAADRALAVDMDFIGIVSGVVATQHSPTPDLTIDVTAGVSYDQAGRRCEITSNVDGFDCSVDENGTSTAVSTPGNERWLSVQLRFDRTLTDPQVDGNGTTVYVDQDESYELAVVMAGEYALGTNTKPALPTDGRLVCDIKLINAQTQILNADIYTDRRQDFSIFSAAQIPVSSGGWAWLNPATDDVQATFTFIDTNAIQTDASREVTQNIIPSAAGRNLGEAAKEWDLYVLELVTVAASRVDGHLLPKSDGNDLGTAALHWSLYSDFIDLDGNLDIDGEIITSAGARVNGNLIPKAGTEALGSATLRWNTFVNTATIYTKLAAAVGGEAIGDASTQFAAFLSALTYYGSITGTLNFSSAASITVRIPLGRIWTANWVFAGGAYYQVSTTPENMWIWFDPPENATITQARIRWYQATATTLTAQMEKADEDNAATNIGASKVVGAAGAIRWDIIFSGGTEVVDKTTYTYRVKVTSGTAEVNQVYCIEVTYDITDILMAALGCAA